MARSIEPSGSCDWRVKCRPQQNKRTVRVFWSERLCFCRCVCRAEVSADDAAVQVNERRPSSCRYVVDAAILAADREATSGLEERRVRGQVE